MEPAHPHPLILDGESLSLADVARVARDPRVEVELSASGLARVERASRLISTIAADYAAQFAQHQAGSGPLPVQDYGVTTGFGEFKDIPIAPAELEALQANLLLSHAVGTGLGSDPDDPGSYYPAEVVRAVLALRLNTFLQGCSGLSRGLVAAVLAMLRRGIVPLVPIHGSVGSSGDLCPLAHTFAVLLGAGRYEVVRTPEDVATGRTGGRWRPKPATELAGDLGQALPKLGPKEGLALINGATFSAAMLALAVVDAEALVGSADAAAALSVEAVCGCARAFDPKIHAARGQQGQMTSAARLRRLLSGSRLLESAGAVQDPYSLRCAPVVHGASRDLIAYARAVAEREANAATDNPLFFPGPDGERHGEEPWDLQFRANWPEGYRGDLRASYSAANFHGQPLALAADALGLAVAELADISERRTQLLLDKHFNRNLPANLAARGGVQSGLMIVQYCAAGLVSENKVLAHPASVDSIPTAANAEDHNSMATIAARKLRTVLANTQAVLAIELLTAAQAIDWRVGMRVSPRAEDAEAEKRRARERAATELDLFRAATAPARRPEIAAHLGEGTRQVYLAVREVAEPAVEDRPFDGDVLAVRRLVGAGKVG